MRACAGAFWGAALTGWNLVPRFWREKGMHLLRECVVKWVRTLGPFFASAVLRGGYLWALHFNLKQSSAVAISRV